MKSKEIRKFFKKWAAERGIPNQTHEFSDIHYEKAADGSDILGMEETIRWQEGYFHRKIILRRHNGLLFVQAKTGSLHLFVNEFATADEPSLCSMFLVVFERMEHKVRRTHPCSRKIYEIIQKWVEQVTPRSLVPGLFSNETYSEIITSTSDLAVVKKWAGVDE